VPVARATLSEYVSDLIIITMGHEYALKRKKVDCERSELLFFFDAQSLFCHTYILHDCARYGTTGETKTKMGFCRWAFNVPSQRSHIYIGFVGFQLLRALLYFPRSLLHDNALETSDSSVPSCNVVKSSHSNNTDWTKYRFRFQNKKKTFSFSEGVQGFSSECILASEKNEWTVGGDMLNRENTLGAKHRNSYFEYDTWGGVDDRNFKKSVNSNIIVDLCFYFFFLFFFINPVPIKY
jgi:hypothetical protein